MDRKNLLSFAQLIADDDEVEAFLFDEFEEYPNANKKTHASKRFDSSDRSRLRDLARQLATICTILRPQTGPNLYHACALA